MNDRIHPIFHPAMAAMYAEPQQFDVFDDDLFHDLCGKRQGPAVQDLLQLLMQLDKTKESFGVNPERFMQMAEKALKKLREACLDDFKEL